MSHHQQPVHEPKLEQFVVIRRMRNTLVEDEPEIKTYSTCSVATQMLIEEAKHERSADDLKTVEVEKSPEVHQEEIQNLLGSLPIRLNEACVPLCTHQVERVSGTSKRQITKDGRSGRRNVAFSPIDAEPNRSSMKAVKQSEMSNWQVSKRMEESSPADVHNSDKLRANLTDKSTSSVQGRSNAKKVKDEGKIGTESKIQSSKVGDGFKRKNVRK